MLDSLGRLLKEDVERQAQWARQEVGAHARSFVFSLIFALSAAACAFGLLVVGLIALFVWAEERYGTMAALGLVAVVLGAAMLVSIITYTSRSKVQPVRRPEIRAADSNQLKAALAADARAAADQTIATLRQSSLGSALGAGEEAIKTGRLVAGIVGDLSEKPPATLIGLGIAVLVGALIGRRL